MRTMSKISEEKKEYKRLSKLYEDIPENKRELVDGLLVEAARLKVSLDELYLDIKENGRMQAYTNTRGDTLMKEREASRIHTALDRSYQTIIKQLNDNLPAKDDKKKGFALLDEDND